MTMRSSARSCGCQVDLLIRAFAALLLLRLRAAACRQDLSVEHGELRLRLCEADAGFQPCDDRRPVRVGDVVGEKRSFVAVRPQLRRGATEDARLQHDRDREIRRDRLDDAEELRRRHADDRDRDAVERDRPADRRRVEGKAALPVLVANHADRAVPPSDARNPIVIGREQPAEEGVDAEHGIEIAGHHLPQWPAPRPRRCARSPETR
jgi:hypothetical protein